MTRDRHDRPGPAGLLHHPLAQRLARTVFAIGLGLTLVVMLTPADDLADPGVDDKVAHALTFLALAVLGRLALVPVRALAVALMAYAALTEVLQALLPIGRHGDPWDLLADTIGVGLGLLLSDGLRRAAAASAAARRT